MPGTYRVGAPSVLTTCPLTGVIVRMSIPFRGAQVTGWLRLDFEETSEASSVSTGHPALRPLRSPSSWSPTGPVLAVSSAAPGPGSRYRSCGLYTALTPLPTSTLPRPPTPPPFCIQSVLLKMYFEHCCLSVSTRQRPPWHGGCRSLLTVAFGTPYDPPVSPASSPVLAPPFLMAHGARAPRP